MTPLYKFIRNPDDVQHILAGRLKFTPIKNLNDPSELLPNVIPEEVRESLKRLRECGYSDEDMIHLRQQEKLLQLLAPDFQAINVPNTKEQATEIARSSFYDNLPLLQRILTQAAEEMSSKVGVLCLTGRNDSLPMWAHYASNAAGLVIEFRDLHDTFSGDETGVLGQPMPVRYERERSGVSFDPRSHHSLFFSKFADWKYEEEFRVILPLSICRSTIAGSDQSYVFDIPKRHIARIIVGWRVDATVIDNVVGLVRSINPHVAVVQARIDNGQVSPSLHIYPR